MTTAIVVTAYNRAEALRQLLHSLDGIRVDHEIPLIISIDNNGTEEVNRIAKKFEWKFGKKEVIIHKQKKGLVNHFIWTGDQTEKYDTVIFLEDDLLASPEMVNYVERIADFYKDDNRVAAASLYNPFINEMTYTRFYQIEDGYDNYFFQQPYWGHVWFRNAWTQFHEYLKTYQVKKDILPEEVRDWKGSFKKIFIQFLIETGKYVVTPRVSYISNNGIPGIHTGDRSKCMQSNMMLKNRPLRLSTLDQSLAVYDSSYEILPSILKYFDPSLAEYDFTVDILGTKSTYKTPYVITAKPVKNQIKGWTIYMKPIELAIVMKQKGDDAGLSLARVEDVMASKKYLTHRRFNDIRKNYPVGVKVSFQFFSFGIKSIFVVIKSKLQGK